MIIWFEKHPKITWIVTLLIMILIFFMSSLSFEKGAPGPDWSFKSTLYHFSIFFLLCFFLCISLIKGQKNKNHFIILGLILAIFYGVSDEIHQYFVPGRACCFEDILTNSIGALSAGVFYSIYLLRKNLLQTK